MRFHWSNGSESLQSCQKLVSINVKKYTEASEACKLNIFTARTVRPQTAMRRWFIPACLDEAPRGK